MRVFLPARGAPACGVARARRQGRLPWRKRRCVCVGRVEETANTHAKSIKLTKRVRGESVFFDAPQFARCLLLRCLSWSRRAPDPPFLLIPTHTLQTMSDADKEAAVMQQVQAELQAAAAQEFVTVRFVCCQRGAGSVLSVVERGEDARGEARRRAGPDEGAGQPAPPDDPFSQPPLSPHTHTLLDRPRQVLRKVRHQAVVVPLLVRAAVPCAVLRSLHRSDAGRAARGAGDERAAVNKEEEYSFEEFPVCVGF